MVDQPRKKRDCDPKSKKWVQRQSETKDKTQPAEYGQMEEKKH